MSRRLRQAIFASIAIASGVPVAQASGSLAELPVESTKPVAVTEYRTAAALAARGSSPIDIALAVAGPFEGATQHVIQANEGSEAPTASRVTVLRDGLLDDSVRGERWDITLQRTAAGVWSIKEVKRAWRCRRGGQPNSFAANRCP